MTCPWRVYVALRHLEEHVTAESLTLNAVARAAGLSPCYLSRKLRNETGERFADRLHRLRVQIATRLLTETAMSVKEVAAASGYKSSQSLARAFAKLLVCTPSEYRRRLLQSRAGFPSAPE